MLYLCPQLNHHKVFKQILFIYCLSVGGLAVWQLPSKQLVWVQLPADASFIMTQTNQEKILVLCAHNDDQIIGAGGTLVKYNKKGIPFKTVIFSFWEGSHPHIKQHLVVETRVREALKSDKILGGNGIAFFGIKEGKFKEEFKAKKIKQRVEWTINQENPTRIFTHSDDDFHPDHKAVYYLVKELIDEKKINCEVYSFYILNLIFSAPWENLKRGFLTWKE